MLMHKRYFFLLIHCSFKVTRWSITCTTRVSVKKRQDEGPPCCVDRFLQSAFTNLSWFYYSSRVPDAALSVIPLWAGCRRLTIRVSAGSYASPQKTGLIAFTLICPVDIIYSSGILHVMTNTHEITTNPQNFREISLTTGRQATTSREGLPSLCPDS